MPEHSPWGTPPPPHRPSTHLAGLQDKHQPEGPLSKPPGSGFERLCLQSKPDCAPRWPYGACRLPAITSIRSRSGFLWTPSLPARAQGGLTTNFGCHRSVTRDLKQEGDVNGVLSTSVQGRGGGCPPLHPPPPPHQAQAHRSRAVRLSLSAPPGLKTKYRRTKGGRGTSVG